MQSAWREGPEALEAARLEALRGKPEALAELMYGGRNGNDQPGDGWRYHGRGFIQLTGKANYRAAGEALDLDLVAHPELAADPRNASRIAVWYWENRVPESARENVRAATLAVNGKYNGLEDRESRFADWQKRLTPDVMERLSHGAATQPAHRATPAAGDQTLREGSHGDAVRALQGHLAQLGYTDAKHRPLTVDGDFGPGTRAALEAFQRDHRLSVDGVAGPRTTAAIDAATRPVVRLDDPAHPDHALFEQARTAVHRLDAQHGRTPDQQSDNLAAALTVAARRQGLASIDEVVLSDDASRAYAVSGAPGSPLRQVADVPTAQAVNTPIAQSASTLPPPAPAPAPAVDKAPETVAQPAMGL